jgi:hypothetical protein
MPRSASTRAIYLHLRILRLTLSPMDCAGVRLERSGDLVNTSL